MSIYSRLWRPSTAVTSDNNGNATFKIGPVDQDQVWTGSVFIDQANSGASARITVSPDVPGFGAGATVPGVPWGSMNGGQALLVEAVSGEVIKIVATGLTANTQFIAHMIGKSAHVRVPAEVGYSQPFPGTSH